MAKIRLKNRRHRLFVADLEKEKLDSKQAVRTALDPKSGVESVRFHEYNTYKQITLRYNQTSELLDDSVLSNASVSGAVRSGWLQVIK